MKSKKITAIVLAMALAAACMLLLVACAKPAPKDSYTVTYNLNDGTGDKRTLTVAAGYAASDWQPVRAGFVLADWCTDKDCTKPYDFEMGVFADTELYANWIAQAEARTIAVDANYGGARHYRSVIVRDGDKLSQEQMPAINKIGMVLEGWYTDAACQTKYDFNAAVTKDMTLYANYAFNDKIARYTAAEAAQIDGVKEGDIKFEDITLGIYCKKSGVYGLFKGVLTEMDQIIAEFNAEYGKTYIGEDGKEHFRIRIEESDRKVPNNEQQYIWNATIQDQSKFQLRVQQIPETNNNLKNYLNINDLLDLANADTSYYDRDNWYAMGDSYVNGGLLSVPLGAKVPFIVYNKAQMDAVLGANGTLPTKYSEFVDVFAKAWETYGSTAGYRTLIQNRAWPFRESVSAAAFIQNGIPYYRYNTETNYYYTDWGTTDGYSKALTAATNINNLLGGGGHGALVNYNDNKDDLSYVVTPVSQGKAFAGIVSWYDDVNNGTDVLSDVIAKVNDGTLGVLPLSGLYSDNDDEWSGKIPVNTVGIQVCTLNSNRPDEYFAACALLSDYVVKRADRFAKYGIVPLNKKLANDSIFGVEENAQSDVDVIKLLNMIVGDPDNLYTMDGYVLGKPLATEIAGTKPLLGYLDYIISATDAATIDRYVRITTNKLTSTFVNGGF